MRILIVDDEAPARGRLRKLLEDLGGQECVGEAADGVSALELCERLTPDVALLDIRMPRMDGLELARHVADLATPPAVIFTTAYDDFALQAFEANAIHYLVKPVSLAKLRSALERAERLRPTAARSLATSLGDPARTHLCVSEQGALRLVPVAQVLCFRADHKYVELLTAEKTWLSELALAALEVEFADAFVRVHRNALVRRQAVAGLQRGKLGSLHVTIEGLSAGIEVSRRHAPAMRRLVRQLADG